MFRMSLGVAIEKPENVKCTKLFVIVASLSIEFVDITHIHHRSLRYIEGQMGRIFPVGDAN